MNSITAPVRTAQRMRAAQQAWDNAVPDSYYDDPVAHKRAVDKAVSEYIKKGWLPNGKDPGHVFNELAESENGLLVCDMLQTYRDKDDAALLAQCKQLMGMIEGIVLAKLGE
ncbi:hypothetical protein DFO67_10454 [Modicisalibacter xianhensis]|uniref:Uncharacterized protein n=1 Tax=Modicisalibacter xianhensis TaxID=442341 RepID=A0A4R8G6A0_9GAMM|nr:hypothetical protein [Halomonas xianhensis]TDX30799.1 hypothetical protein DFO67_10454 [Halomonas xianhensis]